MENTLNQTPSANRTHIGFFGRMNAGKSSLINAFAGQQVSIVSGTAGTTTDVVHKSMEIHGIGPCVLLDTAGLDDSGELGLLRTGAARKAADRWYSRREMQQSRRQKKRPPGSRTFRSTAPPWSPS